MINELPPRGSVTKIVEQLVAGIRSGMSYSGARTISELQKFAEFVQITNNGLKESGPHGLGLTAAR